MEVKSLYIMGLALDFCVKYTAIDAVALGYDVYVVTDGCQSITKDPVEIAQTHQALRDLGCHLLESGDVK